jgi:hypothetical protein
MRRIVLKFLCQTTLMLITITPFQAHAAIEKIATSCDEKFCFHWWPKLPLISGWHHARKESLKIDANVQIQNGVDSENSNVVIYAVAPYKPRMSETKTLENLINNDRADFAAATPDIAIEATDSLVNADGQVLKSFTFTPKSNGRWERVSYGEEGDFYLIFTISAKSKDELNKAMGAYESFIRQYKYLSEEKSIDEAHSSSFSGFKK